MDALTRLRKKPACLAAVFLVGGALLTAWIYGPGLSGGFYMDSEKLYQLLQIYNEQGRHVRLTDLGFGWNFGRIISQVSFYLNIAIDEGLTPYSIKLTNVVIHFVNALLVYAFAVLLLRQTRYGVQRFALAGFISLAWLLSAVNMSSVIYAVQRMNQLATFFSLLALILYLYLRGADKKKLSAVARASLIVPGILVLSIFAFASKENGILVPVFVMLIELYLFPDLSRLFKSRAVLLGGSLAALVALILLSVALVDSPYLDYSARNFTLAERLLTEGRVIWEYLGQLVLPSSLATGIFQDGYPVSRGLFTPPITVAALAGVVGLVAFAVRYRRHSALNPVAFGVAFFLGGHLLESTVLPLDLYYEHRNYLPSVGLYTALVISLYLLLSRVKPLLGTGIVVAYLAFFVFMAHSKSVTWSNDLYAYKAALERAYLSPRAASAVAQKYLQNGQVRPALNLLDRVAAEAPNQAFRARLQKLYVECAAGLPLDTDLYAALPQVTGMELDIEVSQALQNITDSYTQMRCQAIDPDQLLPVLKTVAGKLRTSGRSAWHIDYYIASFLMLDDPQQSAAWLAERFLEGEEPAGWMLLDMIEQRPGLRLSPDTQAALGELRSRTTE